MRYDVIIIGAGVCGSAIARELSRYRMKIAVLEKEEDVCCGTSKANSGIVHAGFDAENGTLMAKLNVEGNQMMEKLSKELDFSFKKNGSLVLCFSEEDRPALQKLYERGVKNGVKELRILEQEEVRKLEPNVSDEVVAALYAPTGGIVCPFGLTIALAENACANGVDFYFNKKVVKLEKVETGKEEAGADKEKAASEAIRETAAAEISGTETAKKPTTGWRVITEDEIFEADHVVNAAGVYADVFHNMVSSRKIHITPRRGEYCLLDKSTGGFVSHTVFQLPGKYGKGVLVSPTVHGNTLVGPTAIDIEEKEGTNTTRTGLTELQQKATRSVKNLPMNQVITSFAGLRAHEDGGEFIIEEVSDAKGFIDCAGIESPGLTSAPAIGKMVADIIVQQAQPEKNENFCGTRKGILDPNTLSKEERAALIKEKPAYGTIICRCEMITEGEIIDAVTRPLGAKSLDGVKRRTRAGMGRCQAGFCSPKTMEIIAREAHIPMEEVTKSGGSSQIIQGINKDRL